MAGLVLVDGQVSDKAGTLVDPEAPRRDQGAAALRLPGGRQARRRARDLRHRRRRARRLSTWAPRPAASSTACCSEGRRGSSPWTWAEGSSTPGLRSDPRVHVIEGVNARYLEPEIAALRAGPPDHGRVVHLGDQGASGGGRAAWPTGSRVSILIKPQFEAGPKDVGKGGIVRDPARAPAGAARDRQSSSWASWAIDLAGLCRSAVPGTGGNVEYFFHLGRGGANGLALDTLETAIEMAVAGEDAGRGEGARVKRKIKRVVILTHGDPAVAAERSASSRWLAAGRTASGVRRPPAEWEKHASHPVGRASTSRVLGQSDDLAEVDLCLVLGGDGTMLRGFHLTRDRGHPRRRRQSGAGGLSHHRPQRRARGRSRRPSRRRVHRASAARAERRSWGQTVFRATNDVVVGKGDRSDASSLALRINGVTLFEVLCDGVVVGTPAGSSAYSLAAGGPLLGISVDAYVISLVAPHAVGVRPVVAAPQDVLEITNTSRYDECFVDIDGQRSAVVPPGGVHGDQDGARR